MIHFSTSTLQSRLDHCVHQTLTANTTTMHHLTGRSIVTISTHISAGVKLEEVNTRPKYFFQIQLNRSLWKTMFIKKQKQKTALIIIVYLHKAHWKQWSHWGHCSVTCGAGTKTSTRECVVYGTGSCHGSSSRTEACHPKPHQCPSTQINSS